MVEEDSLQKNVPCEDIFKKPEYEKNIPQVENILQIISYAEGIVINQLCVIYFMMTLGCMMI